MPKGDNFPNILKPSINPLKTSPKWFETGFDSRLDYWEFSRTLQTVNHKVNTMLGRPLKENFKNKDNVVDANISNAAKRLNDYLEVLHSSNLRLSDAERLNAAIELYKNESFTKTMSRVTDEINSLYHAVKSIK